MTDPSTYVLHFSKRDAATRTYIDTREVLFTGKKLADLSDKLASEFGSDRFTMVKHVPHAFEWKVLDPEESFTEKKKKTERTFKLGELADLKMNPILLKDGDHIALCEEAGDKDDYQTDHDE